MKEWFRSDDFLLGHELADADVERILTLELMGKNSVHLALFEEMTDTEAKKEELLRNIRLHCRILKKKKGESLVRAGEYSNSSFFITEGEVSAQLPKRLPRSANIPGIIGRFLKGKQHDWNVRSDPAEDPAMMIGVNHIVALQETMDRVKHVANINAATDIEVVEIRWPLLREIYKSNSKFTSYVEYAFRRHSLALYLRSLPFFSGLTEEALQLIAINTVFKNFGVPEWFREHKKDSEHEENEQDKQDKISVVDREETIIEQGDRADSLVVIWSGFTRVVHKAHNGFQLLRLQRRGESHGLPLIAENWKNREDDANQVRWSMSLQTVGHVKVLLIPSVYIEDLVMPTLPERFVESIIADRRATRFLHVTQSQGGSGPLDEESAFQAATMGFIEDQKFMNGTQGMLINLDRCVRCFDCMTACANLHGGNAVFSWHGVRHDNIQISNACMHCVDPVCMSECPTGAISRKGNQKEVLINEATCIGCGACAEACPYDNISMMEIMTQVENEDGSKEEKISSKAVKCDLCYNEPHGPGCQDACPHEALLRVDMVNMTAITKWIKR